MTKDDIDHLQLYLGQCLLSENLSQTFLLLEGTPGGGKSTLVNIIEKVIGREHCAELRTSHTTGRFETASVKGKKLLTGKDVSSKFMNNSGSRSLKFLTGGDLVTVEYKGSNKRDNVECKFNIIITSNNTLKISFDGDLEAWRRRIILIKYENKPPEKKIANFDDLLIKEEGSGILNWMMEGAVKLIKSGGKIHKSPQQEENVANLLQSSDSFNYFARLYIHPTSGASITSAEVIQMYTKFCHKYNWVPIAEPKVPKLLKAFMGTNFGVTISHSIMYKGKSKRGYRNFRIRNA